MKTNHTVPRVSVIMPVYNCQKYLAEALVSLQIQTYEDYEVLAINDGSTDNSLQILKSYAKNDHRIKVIDQTNTGIVGVLNRGIKEARGEYIARMDSDDISFPNRFEDQVSLLDSNPELGLVAGNFEVINESSEYLYRELVLTSPSDLERAFFLRNPIAHGSVMFRKSIIEMVGDYSDDFGPTEDLELWMRIIQHAKIGATGTSLYRWRVNMNGITMSNNKESIRQSKGHLARRWEIATPKFLSRKEVMQKSLRYYKTDRLHGAYYKQLFMTDTSQIAVKMIARGNILWGLRQLIVIASTGRTGSRVVMKRLHLIGSGRVSSIRKKLPFGNTPTNSLSTK